MAKVLTKPTERDRGSPTRDLHSYTRNEDIDAQAESSDSGYAAQVVSGSAGIGRDLSQL